MPQRLATTAAVAEECGMGISTIRQYAREGLIPVAGVTPGGHYRYDPAAVKAALKDLGVRLAEKRHQNGVSA